MMTQAMAARVSLGRRVRIRAICMREAHGLDAEARARAAAEEAGVAGAEAHFWRLVADRLARAEGRIVGTANPPLH